MLRLFRNYSPFTVLLLFIAAFIMKLQALSSPVAPASLPDHIVFAGLLHLLDRFLHGSAFAYTLLAVVVLYTQALYLNYISVRHRLFSTNSYLPAFTYLLLTSLHPAYSYFSEPLLINWLVLIAINIMLTFNQTTQPRKQIFNAGFMICVPVLFQFPAIGFVLLFIMALILLRPFHPGEWVVGFMGYFTPLYFFAGILFLTDSIEVLLKMVHIGFSIPRTDATPVYIGGMVAGSLVLLITGSYVLQQQVARYTIYIRRSWALLYVYLLVSVGVSFIAKSSVNAGLLIAMPALGFITTQAFSMEKSKWFSNFAFYFSLLLLIFCQLALHN